MLPLRCGTRIVQELPQTARCGGKNNDENDKERKYESASERMSESQRVG